MRDTRLDSVGDDTQRHLRAEFPQLKFGVDFDGSTVEIAARDPATGRRMEPLRLSVDDYEPPEKLATEAVREVRWWLEHP